MITFKLILRAIYLFVINPRLFLKYLNYRFKRFTREWKNFNLKKFSKKFDGVNFNINIKDFGIGQHYIKQIYFDCYQLDVLYAMKKYLKQGDIFIDVGANIGYFTALGTSLVGKNGQVHAFEPMPDVFKGLIKVKKRNPAYKIILNHYALGNIEGKAIMTMVLGEASGGSSFVEEVMGDQLLIKKRAKIKIARLDRYLQKNNIQAIALIKIDVEGYEFPVLLGLENYFKNTNERPIIVCEITPRAYPRIGYNRFQLINYMKNFGYQAYRVTNDKIPVDITKFKEGEDVIFKSSKK